MTALLELDHHHGMSNSDRIAITHAPKKAEIKKSSWVFLFGPFISLSLLKSIFEQSFVSNPEKSLPSKSSCRL